METFGQVGCSVRRLPIHFMVGTGGTIRMVETFGQVACSVRRPARSYLFRYGHSRTIRMVETFGQVGCSVGRLPIHFMAGTGGTIKSFTARKGGDLRSGRVLGEDAGTIRMRAQVARSG